MGSLCLLLLAACGNEEASCLDEEIADCQPLYEPTFDNVFNRSLQGKCAVSGACHSGESAKAGLRFDEIDASYSALMVGERVLEGDASCSLLSRRLEGQGGSMPPGNPLSEAERCAIHQWIQEGAKR